MKYKSITTLLQYLILGVLLVLPNLAVDAQTPNEPGTDKDSMGKNLPTLDQNPPKVFDTAAFGLG